MGSVAPPITAHRLAWYSVKCMQVYLHACRPARCAFAFRHVMAMACNRSVGFCTSIVPCDGTLRMPQAPCLLMLLGSGGWWVHRLACKLCMPRPFLSCTAAMIRFAECELWMWLHPACAFALTLATTVVNMGIIPRGKLNCNQVSTGTATAHAAGSVGKQSCRRAALLKRTQCRVVMPSNTGRPFPGVGVELCDMWNGTHTYAA